MEIKVVCTFTLLLVVFDPHSDFDLQMQRGENCIFKTEIMTKKEFELLAVPLISKATDIEFGDYEFKEIIRDVRKLSPSYFGEDIGEIEEEFKNAINSKHYSDQLSKWKSARSRLVSLIEEIPTEEG